MTGMMRGILLVMSGVLLTACATEPELIESQSPYSLEASNPLPCTPYQQISNLASPPDIVAGVKQCVAEENYQNAAELLMVAGSFAFFDTQRVKDRTAHGAWTALLAQSLGALPQPQKVELFANLDALSKDGAKTQDVCAHLVSIAPPAYAPEYMLGHGMDAFDGDIDEALPDDFDPAASWKSAREYVKCRA